MIKAAYIHIPFCSNICSYCDFSKLLYHEYWIDKYLTALEKEIDDNYQNEILDSIYIGGGTPSSLNLEESTKLFQILKKFNLNEKYEFTIECNLENLTKEKLDLFKQNGINRLSIGIQTFNEKYLDFLNRKTADTKIIDYAKKIGLNNINIDLIYAIPGQTLEELNKDIDEFLKLNINHISTYSLMIEPNTMLFNKKIKQIDEELDLKMYELICQKLKENNFKHYEISNFSKEEYQSKHNLIYWNNLEYYGFGLGASGYINNIRYTNTTNMKKYIDLKLERDEEKITENSKMQYEMILGLRKLEGINIEEFNKKYKKRIEEVFNIEKLLKERKLILKNNHLKINEEYIYISNDILINFVGEL